MNQTSGEMEKDPPAGTKPENKEAGEAFEELLEVMALLRSPGGCPWDRKQTPADLSRHVIEEAYETVEAIEIENWDHLAEELGDLLLQIIFQTQIAEEEERFTVVDVINGIKEKLVRRHPHVFGDKKVDTADEVNVEWERIKQEEEGRTPRYEFPPGTPELATAMKLQKNASKEGFDWSEAAGVVEKLEEEVEELKGSLMGTAEEIEQELGDVIFSAVNLARHLKVDPARALRRTNREFARRYNYMQEKTRQGGITFAEIPMQEKDRLWEEAKLNSDVSRKEEK